MVQRISKEESADEKHIFFLYSAVFACQKLPISNETWINLNINDILLQEDTTIDVCFWMLIQL